MLSTIQNLKVSFITFFKELSFYIKYYKKIKMIDTNLYYLFDKYEEFFLKTDLSDFIKDSRELVEYNEAVIALENFCSSLYEFDIEISKEDFELIKECAYLMQISDDTWNFLEPLVK